jgi:hypothetical protein
MSDVMELTPEEEALWRASDEDIEKGAYDTNKVFDEAEQPDETQDDEPEEEVDEVPAEDDNSDPEGDEDSDNEQAEDEVEEEESVEEEPEAETEEEAKAESGLRPVRADGMDIPVKSLDEVYNLASMGVNYKKKMADIAPFRRSISAMKENGVTESDINKFIDIRNGNKDALQSFIKELGVDPLDIDVETDNHYIPTEHGVDESTTAIQEIVEEISKDPEYAMTQKVVDSQWDSESRKVLAQNPTMIRGLHEEIKKGVYAKVAPEALRLELLDNGKRSKLEYYLAAEKLYYEAEQAKQSKNVEVVNTQRQKVVQKKRAAAPTNSRATSSKTATPDFENMSDEEYEKFYNSVMRS